MKSAVQNIHGIRKKNIFFCHDSVFSSDIPGKAVYIITRFFTDV